MILGPISILDVPVIITFLISQLFLQAGLITTAISLIKILPATLFVVPLEVVYERYLQASTNRSQFALESYFFEHLIVIFLRHAFKLLPPKVARVLMTKQVALPMLRWRMLRHGYLRYPVHVEHLPEGQQNIGGTWIKQNPDGAPDVVVYYIHGGGYAMGSSYFYLEFLLAWHQLLVESGYKNPAIFAIDYTLTPEATYPTAVIEAIQGYQHVIEYAKDTSKICVAGDSAGGGLTLNLLLELGTQAGNLKSRANPSSRGAKLGQPHMAILISPWATLVSNLHQSSNIDYLNRERLWDYGHAYSGRAGVQSAASPGSCNDRKLWQLAAPTKGYYVVYSEVEALAGDAIKFIGQQRGLGVDVEELNYAGGVHAWPVVCLVLASTRERRLHGLRAMTKAIREKF